MTHLHEPERRGAYNLQKFGGTTWFVTLAANDERVGTINYPGNHPKGTHRYHAIASDQTDLGHFEFLTEAMESIARH